MGVGCFLSVGRSDQDAQAPVRVAGLLGSRAMLDRSGFGADLAAFERAAAPGS